MLEIIVNGGRLDLPEDIELSVEESNPLWSEEVSFSYPCTVKLTDRNLGLLGHPEQYANMAREVSIPCTVSHEGYLEEGIIRFLKLNMQERTIEFSMLLSGATWVEYARETMLRDIRWPEPIAVAYDDEGTASERMQRRREFVDQLLSVGSSYPWVGNFFDKAWSITREEDYDRSMNLYEFCNAAFVSSVSDRSYTTGALGRDFTYNIKKYDIVNASSFYVGPCTPLLFIRTILKYLFQGYVVQGNPFLKGDLARAFVFNDHICYFENGDLIDYSKLVPDVSVAEFLAMVETLSGTRCVVDYRNRVVTFTSYAQAIRATGPTLPGKIEVSIKDQEPKRFILSTELVSSDYSGQSEHCGEEFQAANRYQAYATINYEHTLLRDRDDKGKPWEEVTEYPEQVVFDRSLRCFGIEKWTHDSDRWQFKRALLGNTFYPKEVGSGDKKVEKKLDGVVHNALTCFNRWFWDAEGKLLELESHYVVQLPYYPCRFESTTEEMHDFEKIAFSLKDNAPTLGISIFRGLQKLYWRKNTYDVHIRQNGTRDEFDPWGTESYGMDDNREYYYYANADVYDTAGERCEKDLSDVGNLGVKSRGRFATSSDLISLRPKELYERFYWEYAKVVTQGVTVEVSGKYASLNRVPLEGNVYINHQKFAMVKRKRTLTLHHNVVAATELLSIPAM